MIKIRVKIQDVEIEVIDSSVSEYPRIVSTDKYKDITKSDRMIEVIKEISSEAIRVFNSKN